MGRKKTDSLAKSVALRVSLAVASESFCCVKLKYYMRGGVVSQMIDRLEEV